MIIPINGVLTRCRPVPVGSAICKGDRWVGIYEANDVGGKYRNRKYSAERLYRPIAAAPRRKRKPVPMWSVIHSCAAGIDDCGYVSIRAAKRIARAAERKLQLDWIKQRLADNGTPLEVQKARGL